MIVIARNTTYIGDNSGDTSFRFVDRSIHAVNLCSKSWIIRSSIGELSAYHVWPFNALQAVCKSSILVNFLPTPLHDHETFYACAPGSEE